MQRVEARRPIKPEKPNPHLAHVERVLGKKSTDLLERMKTSLDQGTDLAKAESPFAAKFKPQEMPVIPLPHDVFTAYTALTSLVVDYADKDLLEEKEAVIGIIRANLPLIRNSTPTLVREVSDLRDAAAVAMAPIESMKEQVERLAVGNIPPEETVNAFRTLGWMSNTLKSVAETIPVENVIITVRELLDIEAKTRITEALLTGLLIDPSLADEYSLTDDLEEQFEIANRACLIGDQDPEVNRHHRSLEEQAEVRLGFADARDELDMMIGTGTRAFEYVKKKSVQMMHQGVLQQAGLIEEAHAANETVLKEKLQVQPESASEHIMDALVTEAHISDLTKHLRRTLHKQGVTVGKEMRAQFDTLEARPLAKEIKKAAKKRPAIVENPYREVEFDDNSRHCIKTAKGVLKGGRFDSATEELKKAAQKLHSLEFTDTSKHAPLRLEVPEAGVVMAIICGNFQDFLSFASQCRDFARGVITDSQIAKFKHEYPEQFSSLVRFDLKKIAEKILNITSHVHRRQGFAKIFREEQIRRIDEALRPFHGDQAS